MAKHNETGKKGEALGACWLLTNGFQILFKNWRDKRGEIDIIATRQGVIHFVEVKTSSSSLYGFPEDRINRRKLKAMSICAVAFLKGWPNNTTFQFDVLSISIQGKTVDYYYIPNITSDATFGILQIAPY